jgi:hypothetical protein
MIGLTTGDTGLRELDHRSNEDVEVTLLWSAQTDRVFVLVLERRTEALFRFEVAPEKALEAFPPSVRLRATGPPAGRRGRVGGHPAIRVGLRRGDADAVSEHAAGRQC